MEEQFQGSAWKGKQTARESDAHHCKKQRRRKYNNKSISFLNLIQ